MASLDHDTVKQEVNTFEHADTNRAGEMPATHEVNEMALLRKIDWHLVPVSSADEA